MLVEEVPKQNDKNSLTIYFLSLINLLARPAAKHYDSSAAEDANRNSKNRPKVNYNLTDLLNAQTQANYSNGTITSGNFKSLQQLQLEKLIVRRLGELSKETPNANFEIPKTFGYTSIHTGPSGGKKVRLGNTPSTKKILAARRNLNSYFEEEKNLISINTILGVNFSFAEQNDELLQSSLKKRRVGERVVKPKAKICCICGTLLAYSRCSDCGLYSCSVRCIRVHHESRCN